MNENELRQSADCKLCEQPFGRSGLPLFWRVRVERFGINANAIRRQDGLAAQLGSSFLANVMGPDEEMATPIGDPIEFTICETCAGSHPFLLYEILPDPKRGDET